MTSRQRIRVPLAGREEFSLKTQRLIAAASAVAALSALAAPAAAQVGFATSSRDLNIVTSVPAYCQTPFGSTSPSLDVGSLTGANGFAVTTFNGTTSYQSTAAYYCNAPATVTLSATPLRVTPNVDVAADQTDSFTNRVDYTATLTWNTVTGQTTSDAAAATLTTSTANTGQIRVEISEPKVQGNRRPIAGAYAGAVTVTIAPTA